MEDLLRLQKDSVMLCARLFQALFHSSNELFRMFFLLFICRGCIRPRTAGLGVGNEGYEVNRKTQEHRQLVRSLYTRWYVSPDCSDLRFPVGRSSTVAFLQEMLLITSHAISCISFCRGLFILCNITPAISSTTKYICT